MDIFNEIKEEGFDQVKENDVVNYIEDKNNPPIINPFILKNKENMKNLKSSLNRKQTFYFRRATTKFG